MDWDRIYDQRMQKFDDAATAKNGSQDNQHEAEIHRNLRNIAGLGAPLMVLASFAIGRSEHLPLTHEELVQDVVVVSISTLVATAFEISRRLSLGQVKTIASKVIEFSNEEPTIPVESWALGEGK